MRALFPILVMGAITASCVSSETIRYNSVLRFNNTKDSLKALQQPPAPNAPPTCKPDDEAACETGCRQHGDREACRRLSALLRKDPGPDGDKKMAFTPRVLDAFAIDDLLCLDAHGGPDPEACVRVGRLMKQLDFGETTWQARFAVACPREGGSKIEEACREIPPNYWEMRDRARESNRKGAASYAAQKQREQAQAKEASARRAIEDTAALGTKYGGLLAHVQCAGEGNVGAQPKDLGFRDKPEQHCGKETPPGFYVRVEDHWVVWKTDDIMSFQRVAPPPRVESNALGGCPGECHAGYQSCLSRCGLPGLQSGSEHQQKAHASCSAMCTGRYQECKAGCN